MFILGTRPFVLLVNFSGLTLGRMGFQSFVNCYSRPFVGQVCMPVTSAASKPAATNIQPSLGHSLFIPAYFSAATPS